MAAEHNQQIAVVGAVAYDQISKTATRLTNGETPLLNCKLTSLDEDFGGCGGNIAYNLAALGRHCQLITCSGTADDERYLQHCAHLGIPSHAFLRTAGEHCARAIIITDPRGKQFTGFFAGPIPGTARWLTHLAKLDLAQIAVFLQAPYPPALMQASLEHASTLTHLPLKIWCPGQYADQLDAEQIATLTGQCDWIVGNAHEVAHLETSSNALRDKLVIRTNGAGPVEVTYPDGSTSLHTVPSAPHSRDPTGCGDAFLAVVAHRVAAQPDKRWQDMLPEAIAAGNAAAAACLVQTGGQQHRLAKQD